MNLWDEAPKPIRELIEKYGKGWYMWQHTLGLSNVAYLDSRGTVMVYNHYGNGYRQARHELDEYDFLRALESGRVCKMTTGEFIEDFAEDPHRNVNAKRERITTVKQTTQGKWTPTESDILAIKEFKEYSDIENYFRVKIRAEANLSENLGINILYVSSDAQEPREVGWYAFEN